MAAFEQGLRDLGYEPGKDVLIDLRSAEGNLERYRQLVQEIVRTKPDVILTGVNANTTAVRAATQTLPIVMMLGSDVIRAGYAKTLAKPGGNITGLTSDVGADVITKRLELLREAAPKISRLAVISEKADVRGLRLLAPVSVRFDPCSYARACSVLFVGWSASISRQAMSIEVRTRARLRRDLAHEIAIVAVRPVHHRRHAKSVR